MAWFFRHEACRDRFRQLEDRLDTTERRLRALDAEFTDLYDRTQRQVERLVKRRQRDPEGAGEATATALPAESRRLRAVGDLPEHPEPPGPRRNY